MTLFERIRRGEAAIAKARGEGRDVRDWEAHLNHLAAKIAEAEPAGPSFAEQAAEIDSGKVQAVLIDSAVLNAPLWLAFDAEFDPGDGLPVFYADEIQFLKDKPAATLRKTYETKLAFGPRARVIQ